MTIQNLDVAGHVLAAFAPDFRSRVDVAGPIINAISVEDVSVMERVASTTHKQNTRRGVARHCWQDMCLHVASRRVIKCTMMVPQCRAGAPHRCELDQLFGCSQDRHQRCPVNHNVVDESEEQTVRAWLSSLGLIRLNCPPVAMVHHVESIR